MKELANLKEELKTLENQTKEELFNLELQKREMESNKLKIKELGYNPDEISIEFIDKLFNEILEEKELLDKSIEELKDKLI